MELELLFVLELVLELVKTEDVICKGDNEGTGEVEKAVEEEALTGELFKEETAEEVEGRPLVYGLSVFSLSFSRSHCLSLFQSILIIIIAVFFLSPTTDVRIILSCV